MHAVIPKGAELSSVVAIVGMGTSIPIEDIQRLVSKCPGFGDVSSRQQKSGIAVTDKFSHEIHWYENAGVFHLAR